MLERVHAGATWFMVGVIWFVQLVHYPLLASAPAAAVAANIGRTELLVVPVMLTEAAAAAALAARRRGGRGGFAAAGGAALLAAIWVLTLAVMLPMHARLSERPSEALFASLLAANWLRTALWSVRGALALALLERRR